MAIMQVYSVKQTNTRYLSGGCISYNSDTDKKFIDSLKKGDGIAFLTPSGTFLRS